VEHNPPMDRNCFVCGKIGHSSRECPNGDAMKKRRGFKNVRKYEQKILECYSCGAQGHLARDCTDVCNKCKKHGHIALNCTHKPQTKNETSNIEKQQQPPMNLNQNAPTFNQHGVAFQPVYYNVDTQYQNSQFQFEHQFYMQHTNPTPLLDLNTSVQLAQYQVNSSCFFFKLKLRTTSKLK
jgi:hypothetical protein